MHVPDLDLALAELARVLAPGGRLAIMENNAASLHHRVWDRAVRAAKRVLGRPVHEWRRTPRGLEEWREAEGGGLMVRRADQAWSASSTRAVVARSTPSSFRTRMCCRRSSSSSP